MSLSTVEKAMRFVILLALTFGCTGAWSAAPDNTRQAPQLRDCSMPPIGIIRFALRSDKNTVDVFEWSDRTIRKVKSEPLGDSVASQFPTSSTYKWKYWEISPAAIDRAAVSASSILSTPYAMSSDGKTLVSGLQQNNGKVDFERDSEPSSLVFLEVGSSKVLNTVDIGKSIHALSWNPTSSAVVVMTIDERYGKKTLRERSAASIGHPIPYSDITLTIIGRDGVSICSVAAAKSLPYGTGFVRWDDK
jgi:hypothetical protein